MYHAQTHVGECHTGHVLTQGHALAAIGVVLHSLAQALGDEFHSLDIERISQFPGSQGGVTLDGVGKGVHTGSGGQALGHGAHHVGVNHSHHGDVVRVHAHELAALGLIGNHVVDGGLSSGAGGGSHSNHGHALVLGGGKTLQAHHIGELGVVDDDADSLGCVLGRTTTDGNHIISTGGLESLHTGGHHIHAGVGLHLVVNLVCATGGVQQSGHLGNHAELHQISIGHNQSLGETTALHFGHNSLHSTVAVVARLVQNKAFCGHAATIPISSAIAITKRANNHTPCPIFTFFANLLKKGLHSPTAICIMRPSPLQSG